MPFYGKEFKMLKFRSNSGGEVLVAIEEDFDLVNGGAYLHHPIPEAYSVEKDCLYYNIGEANYISDPLLTPKDRESMDSLRKSLKEEYEWLRALPSWVQKAMVATESLKPEHGVAYDISISGKMSP